MSYARKMFMEAFRHRRERYPGQTYFHQNPNIRATEERWEAKQKRDPVWLTLIVWLIVIGIATLMVYLS